MNPFNQFVAAFGGYLPNILAAVAILIVGWILALIVSRLVGSLLKRTNLDDRLANLMRSDPNMTADRIPIQRWVTGAVFWVIMLFAIVAFLQVLNLAIVGGPLNLVLNQILGFIPGLLSALLLLLAAWVIATLLRMIIVRVMGASGLSRRLSENAQVRTQDRVTIGETIGNIVYWLVFLLFLPAILGALNLQGILAPVQNMVNEVLAALPNILAAVLILALGYLAARIVRQIVTGLLAGIGVDRIGRQAGLPEENQVRLSNVLGTVVFVLIIIPVAIAALNALNIPAISTPAAQMLTTLLNALPAIFGAILLLALAYFVARILGNFVAGILANLGFDRLFRSVGLEQGRAIPTTGPANTWSPSRIIGTLVTVAVVLFAVVAAANMLGFPLLADMVSDFMVLAGNIVLGLVIFGLGLYLASLADRAIRGSGASQAGILATAARAAIIVFTGALALRQMGIGEDIVNLAFGLLLGAVAVAAALAFGLGGRDVAARQLERWRGAIQSNNPGGAIPHTGKSIGESFRDTFKEDVDRAQGAVSSAKEHNQQDRPDAGYPGEFGLPPAGGQIPSTGKDTGMTGGIYGAGVSGDVEDPNVQQDIPDTGDVYDTGLDRDIPDTGMGRDVHTGMDQDIPDTGDVYDAGIGRDIPDTGDVYDTELDRDIPDTGLGRDVQTGLGRDISGMGDEIGDTGAERNLPDTGLDAEMPGEIPDTGDGEDSDLDENLDDYTRRDDGGSDQDDFYRRRLPPDAGL